MKKMIFMTALALISAGYDSKANSAVLEIKQDASSVRRALRIQKALEILSQAGILSRDEEDNSIKVDNSILEDLRKEGLIKELDSKEGVVCVDGGA